MALIKDFAFPLIYSFFVIATIISIYLLPQPITIALWICSAISFSAVVIKGIG